MTKQHAYLALISSSRSTLPSLNYRLKQKMLLGRPHLQNCTTRRLFKARAVQEQRLLICQVPISASVPCRGHCRFGHLTTWVCHPSNVLCGTGAACIF